MLMAQRKEQKDTRLYRHLKKWLEKAVMDFKMVEEGDKLLIGISGGADSYVLLDLLDSPMIFVPRFSFVVVNIDMGFDPSYKAYNSLEKYLQEIIIVILWKRRISGLWRIPRSIKKIPAFFARVCAAKEYLKLPLLKDVTK